MPKFIVKPIIFEAWLWDGENHELRERLTEANAPVTNLDLDDPKALYISDSDGLWKVKIGDYVIKGLKGNFFTCEPDIFNDIYTPYIDKSTESLYPYEGH